MIHRHDFLTAPTEVPKALKATLLRVGGKNIYSEPMYRLCLAQDRIKQAAGAWTIWKPGTSLDDKSGLGIREIQQMLIQYRNVMEAAELACSKHEQDRLQQELGGTLNELIAAKMVAGTPLAVNRGMADIPIYNCEGWIIEKWKPAHTFGPPDEWYAFRFEGQAALGPYPQHGEYEICAGPTPYQPSAQQLEEAIRETERIIDERPASAAERLVKTMADIERHQALQDRETHNLVESIYKDSAPLMNRISLGAGKVRTQLALAAGVKEHVGN